MERSVANVTPRGPVLFGVHGAVVLTAHTSGFEGRVKAALGMSEFPTGRGSSDRVAIIQP
jgi:hypothetical protein